MNGRACAKCRFAEREHMQGQIQRVLVCHFGPPTMSMYAMSSPQGGQAVHGSTQFPIVHPANWCYQFEAVKEGETIEGGTGSGIQVPR